MAYRQPRPPQPREGDERGYIAELNRFLREFCTAAWDADRRRDAQMARMSGALADAERRIAALEAAKTTDGGEG